MQTLDFDDMLEELGEMGRFQITTYILVCVPVLFAAANSLSYVFTAGVPNYRCLVPGCDDEIHPQYSEHWLEYAIPGEKGTDNYKPSQCTRYVSNVLSNQSVFTCSKMDFTSQIEKCNEWVFDSERTIVNDWKITCVENQWMLSLVGSSHFAGIIVGSAVFGILADRYGRKNIFIICILLMSLGGVLQSIAPEYVSFTILIFVNSLGTSGIYPLAFIIGVELVGRRKREVTGMVLNYFYAIGEALVALIAWIVEDWVLLQIIVSAPPVLFIFYYWYVPESVRWLLTKRRNEKAKVIVCRAAKINGVTLSENLLVSFSENDALNKDDTQLNNDNNMLTMIKIMMRSKKLIWRFVIVYYIWAANAFIYYGLSVNSTSMSGNKYVNFALVCLIEIPGYTLAWVCIQKFGRRSSLVGSLLLCGFTCGISVVVSQRMSWLVIVLFLTGKLGVTAAFGIVYVHTAEMLPTAIRSGGVGSASTIARVGALLAPFVPLLGVYVQPLPMLLFGVVGLSAGLLALKLPETLGIKLPETVQEAERL